MRKFYKYRVNSNESDAAQCRLTANIQQLRKQDEKLSIISQRKLASCQQFNSETVF